MTELDYIEIKKKLTALLTVFQAGLEGDAHALSDLEELTSDWTRDELMGVLAQCAGTLLGELAGAGDNPNAYIGELGLEAARGES